VVAGESPKRKRQERPLLPAGEAVRCVAECKKQEVLSGRRRHGSEEK